MWVELLLLRLLAPRNGHSAPPVRCHLNVRRPWELPRSRPLAPPARSGSAAQDVPQFALDLAAHGLAKDRDDALSGERTEAVEGRAQAGPLGGGELRGALVAHDVVG